MGSATPREKEIADGVNDDEADGDDDDDDVVVVVVVVDVDAVSVSGHRSAISRPAGERGDSSAQAFINTSYVTLVLSAEC